MTVNYGLFLNTLINFLIVAFALFIIIKQINRLTAPRVVEKPGDPPPPEDIRLLREIRDALKEGQALARHQERLPLVEEHALLSDQRRGLRAPSWAA